MTTELEGRRHTGLHAREEYTSDELIRIGDGLARAMGEPAVNIALRSVQQNILAEMHDSEPHESKKRDALHAELRALTRLSWMLSQLINQARTLEQHVLDDERRRMQAEVAPVMQQAG